MALVAHIDHETGNFADYDGAPGSWIYSNPSSELTASQAAFTVGAPTVPDDAVGSKVLRYDGRPNPSSIARPLWGPRFSLGGTYSTLYVTVRATIIDFDTSVGFWEPKDISLRFLDNVRSISPNVGWATVGYDARTQYALKIQTNESNWWFELDNANSQSGASNEGGLTEFTPPTGWFWHIAPGGSGGSINYFDFGEWAEAHFKVEVDPGGDFGSIATIYRAEADSCASTATIDTMGPLSFGGDKNAFSHITIAGNGAIAEIDNIAVSTTDPTCPADLFPYGEGWGTLL